MKKILIVDDQPNVRRLLEVVLKKDDRELHFAENGFQAVEVAKKVRPDLILLDIMMPGAIDGFEAARLIKNTPATSDCTIVALSASIGDNDQAKALESGANAYLTKPFDITSIRDRVDAYLKKSTDEEHE